MLAPLPVISTAAAAPSTWQMGIILGVADPGNRDVMDVHFDATEAITSKTNTLGHSADMRWWAGGDRPVSAFDRSFGGADSRDRLPGYVWSGAGGSSTSFLEVRCDPGAYDVQFGAGDTDATSSVYVDLLDGFISQGGAVRFSSRHNTVVAGQFIDTSDLPKSAATWEADLATVSFRLIVIDGSGSGDGLSRMQLALPPGPPSFAPINYLRLTRAA